MGARAISARHTESKYGIHEYTREEDGFRCYQVPHTHQRTTSLFICPSHDCFLSSACPAGPYPPLRLAGRAVCTRVAHGFDRKKAKSWVYARGRTERRARTPPTSIREQTTTSRSSTDHSRDKGENRELARPPARPPALTMLVCMRTRSLSVKSESSSKKCRFISVVSFFSFLLAWRPRRGKEHGKENRNENDTKKQHNDPRTTVPQVSVCAGGGDSDYFVHKFSKEATTPTCLTLRRTSVSALR